MDWLIKDIEDLIPMKTEVHDDDNLLGLGLTSLKIMKMVSKWRKKGIKISFGKLMQEPTLRAWKELLENATASSTKEVIAEKKERISVFGNIEYNKKFPLTDIQYAYKFGREDGRELGGIGCHAYIEFNSGWLDSKRLDDAWHKVLMHHPMLRAKFTDDGMQQICEEPFNGHITIIDLRGNEDTEKELLEVRERLSHRRFHVELGEVAGLTLCIVSENDCRMIFDIDLLSADVMSFSVILRDLADAYLGKELSERDGVFDFGKYISLQSEKEENERKSAYEYWQKRIPDMPLCPELPLKKLTSEVSKTVFNRRIVKLNLEEWTEIQKICRRENITPAVLTLTAFAMCIAKWSRNDRFLINIPYFNRNTEYDGIENAVADFTTLLLLEVDLRGKPTFRQALDRISKQLHEDMEHTAYSGVNIQRDITKMLGGQTDIAPVVFACNFGSPLISESCKKAFGYFNYMISQTPGVWLDFQSYEDSDGLMLTWDTVDELFCDGVLDDMMESLQKIMKSVIKNDWDSHWDLLPNHQRKFIQAQKSVEDLPSPRNLFAKFIENAKTFPNKTAIIDKGNDTTLTYGELLDKALRVANFLVKKGIKRSPIAISLTRGYGQAVSALGILMSDNIYVPVTTNQPTQRRIAIYESIGIEYTITDRNSIEFVIADRYTAFSLENMMEEEPLSEMLDVSPDSSAYIIMTSGTTGLPKGAEMYHKGASNTIDDVNLRFGIGSDDTILGVSSMDFDLSVYDLFGTLSAGGTLVQIPEDKKRDTEYWLDVILECKVNVWNSVPMLLDMLLLTATKKQSLLPFKVVMLSGDWIGMDIPERVYNCTEKCRFVSMGGATEASIWSNYQEVTLPMPKGWRSIPYGRPLSYQSYRVIDENGDDVPFNVEGELIIGGVGVGTYRGADELTAKKFFVEDGLSWYRTGDKGTFWNDGTIEFLGRRDFQVKIRGHRIELGEIESAIKKIPNIDRVAVEATDTIGDKHLTAFIESSKKTEPLYNKDTQLIELIENRFNKVSLPNVVACDVEMADSIDSAVLSVIGKIIGKIDSGSIAVTPLQKDVVAEWNKALVNYSDKEYNIDGLPNLKKYLETISPYLEDIIVGKSRAIDVYYAENAGLTPMELYYSLPETKQTIENIIRLLNDTAENGKILEIETRDINTTRKILNSLRGRNIEYVYYDSSAYFVEKLKCLESEFDFFESRLTDFSVSKKADVVICFNSLHRMANTEECLKNIKNTLKADGELIIQELTGSNSLMLISATVLENGKDNTLNTTQISSLLHNSDFDLVKNNNFGLFVGMSTSSAYTLNEEYITGKISDKLPEYMIPHVYYPLKKLPISRNGKIDRKALKQMTVVDVSANDIVSAETETQKVLVEIWSELFGTDKVGILDNYYQLGGDSLLAIKLLNAIKDSFSIDFTVGDVMENITIKAQADVIDRKMNNSTEITSSEENFVIEHDSKNAYEPFPLTDVQRAYWLGRSNDFTLGGVSTHCYFELKCDMLDIQKAEDALNSLIKAHGMMRVVIDSDGNQRILENVPKYRIEKADFKALRERMQSQVIDLEEWPLFDIKISENDCRQIIHVSFDNIVFDGWSMFRLLTEWNERYKGDSVPENVEITFRDYVLGLERIKSSQKYQLSREYWNDRIEGFSNAPEFNLKKQETEIVNPKFVRRSHSLSPSQWKSLKNTASKCMVTPSVLLMTAYSDVIRRWSKNKDFSLNLTRFDRKPLHKDIGGLVGDFTTLYLLEVKNSEEKTFAERAKWLQNRLSKDMEHSDYSAIEVERSLRIRNRNLNNSIMPIVFTSGLGVDQWNEGKWLGKLTYNVSQTPQVWLDHQVVEQNGGLGLFWDSIDELFFDGVVDDMFEAYTLLLEKIADSPNTVFDKSYNLSEVKIDEQRIDANMNNVSYDVGTLDGNFIQSSKRFSERTALSCNGRDITYSELRELSLGITERLLQVGVNKSEPIAILADKGFEQVVFALGILMAGCVYVPLDVHNPYDRIKKILINSGITNILVTPKLAEKTDWLNGYEKILYDGHICKNSNIIVPHSPDDTAYIIYTSGSTGEPKGVVISHGGALNTILDVNDRFGVTENDSAFGISGFNFDLSVYDIFGMLTVGGRLYIPDSNRLKEPEYWIDVISNEHITLWNSVPAFADMLVSYEKVHRKLSNASVDKFFLSGDWIGLTLPTDLKDIFKGAKVIAMGGATEASIWSNYFEVPDDIPTEWRSIPYGKPLANQRYYILDSNLEDCPLYVQGDIFIGGKGVAKGYMNDVERTRQSFITHPVTHEYLYKTGDIGQYWRDGNIEFLGRLDNQIKINGYRVEEGEIESAIGRIENVISNKVIFKDNTLTAFIIYKDNADDMVKDIIAEELRSSLPEYMVPQNFIRIEKYPLTTNGKIDIKELCRVASEKQLSSNLEGEKLKPITDTEKKLAEIWKDVLGCEEVYLSDDFFMSGGDSLKAIRIMNSAENVFNVSLKVRTIFSNPILQTMALAVDKLLEQNNGHNETNTEEGEL